MKVFKPSKNKFWIFNLFILISISIVNIGCKSHNTNTVDRIEQTMQDEMELNAHKISPLPDVENFVERLHLKHIYEVRDSATINYAYLFNQSQGKLLFLGRCVGYQIPYGTQYTSSQKLEDYTSNNFLVLPQGEPNGLYMPLQGAIGSWIMLLDDKNEPRVVYLGVPVIVSPIPLEIK